jgi:hypothetical protein
LHTLVDLSPFGAFLRAGIEQQQLPLVRTACIRVATALQIRPIAELTLPPARTAAAGSAAAMWRRTTQQPVSA